MPSDLTIIRQALADALEAGLSGVQVSRWLLANPTLPSVQLWPAEIEYHRAFQDGLAFWRFTVRALFALSSDIGSQQALDELLGENVGSVKAALEADRTLGGACDRVIVRTAGNYASYVLPDSGTQVVAADWSVDVYR